jgi:hypothetical protein
MLTKLLPVALTGVLFLAGCGGPTTGSSGPAPAPAKHGDHAHDADEAKVQANLAKLGDEDRKLAEAQKYCAVEQDHLLGAMGKPVKVMVKDQPVFLCCPSCEEEAQAHPEKTLARVRELKEKAGAPPK